MEVESESGYQESLFSSRLLGDFNLDIEKSLKNEDDFFQFSSDFDIPLLEDASSESLLGSDVLMDFRNEDETFPWALSSNDLKTISSLDCGIFCDDIKAEPSSSSTSSSTSQTGSETWTTNGNQLQIKFEVETPPISPGQDKNSPPSSPGSIILLDPLPSDIKVLTQPLPPVPVVFKDDVNAMKAPTKVFVSVADFNNVKQAAAITPKLIPSLNTIRSNTLPVLPSPTLVSTPAVTSSQQFDSQLKALKRRQRMIKNRESACLSRKKKKEYVTSLESQISELHQENKKLKQVNLLLMERLSRYESTNTPNKSPLLTKTKKTTAVLAVLFVMSLNFNSFSLFNRNRDELQFGDLNLRQNSSSSHTGRSLLWTHDDSLLMNSSRNFSNHDFTTRNFNNGSALPTCPLYINHTESLRLDSELRRWIGVDFDDSDSVGGTKSLDKPPGFKNILSQIMLPYLPTKFTPPVAEHKLKIKSNKIMKQRENHVIDLYSGERLPNANEPLLEALNRRDDTFYVVSFSGDHLLLPALALNKTARPKMSLVFPALSFNDSTKDELVTMMQIDCAVTDTKLLQFREAVIPMHMRKVNNVSRSHNHKAVHTKSIKPFFMKSSHKYNSFSEEQP